MTTIESAKAQQLAEHEDVQAALRDTVSEPPVAEPSVETAAGLWFAPYLLALIVLVALHAALSLAWLPLRADLLDLALRLTTGSILLTLLLLGARAAEIFWLARVESAAARYNLKHVLRLVVTLLGAAIVASILSLNWYAMFASLGLVSLILGLALQNPLTSFFGWIYILVRAPYRVGDRIRIGDAKGDVIKVTYLDTTLWEFGGPYLSTDHPSGRIIKFPNAQVFREPVFNYSWPLFPYVWNEVKFQVAYDSDLEFVSQVMQEEAAREMGELMMEQVRVYRTLLAQTPVDELEVNEQPTVIFRVNDNTWLEAIVRYLVHPKEGGRTKSRLIKRMLARLNAEPERVLFPKSNMR